MGCFGKMQAEAGAALPEKYVEGDALTSLTTHCLSAAASLFSCPRRKGSGTTEQERTGCAASQ